MPETSNAVATRDTAQTLLELNRSKHIYEGTVDRTVVAKRRAANKRARAARRASRKSAA